MKEIGFSDLVSWVDTGVRPAGDDIFATADPLYGCTHTSSDRFLPPPIAIPACPKLARAAAPGPEDHPRQDVPPGVNRRAEGTVTYCVPDANGAK